MVVLITGASSGLGWWLAREFGRQGWHVVGTSHDGSAGCIHWDALNTSPDAMTSFISQITMPKVDLVINNAGINAICEFGDLSQGFIHDILQVNAVAPVMLVKELLMRDRLSRPARVCNVISDAAWRPMRHSLAYNMSKAALDIATKQMARELTKPHSLTVFGVRPGKMSDTGMSKYIDEQVCRMRGWTSEQALEYFRANSVTGKEAKPLDVAKLIYTLCTSWVPISGACIDLCG